MKILAPGTMTETRQTPRPLYIRGWGAAMFLVARDIEPIGAEFAKDGSGTVVYLFPSEAADELALYHRAKDRLNAIAEGARHAY